MKLRNKIVSCFLVLVLAIQILPVKQVIKYFLIDYPLTEELVETKGATKNPRFLLDEDHKLMHCMNHLSHQLTINGNTSAFHYAERLPEHYTADITTPPPNKA